MLTLTVTRHNGQRPARPLSASFDAEGGTIGRAGTNRLVLDDPERTVSRMHAQIVWHDGRYGLIDRGSNPALVNGTALEPGQEVPLRDGDEVQIGGYQLRAEVAHDDTVPSFGAPPAAVADPFADLFGDPAAASGATSGIDDLLRASAPRGESPPPRPTPNALPDDFDLGLDNPAASRSIDELFDLSPGMDFGTGTGAGSLFPHSPLDDPPSAPNTAHGSDPFASLTGSVRPVAPSETVSDEGSELHSAFTPPRMRAVAPEPPPLAASRPGETPARADGDPALLAAFLRGLDTPGVDLDALTPALMQLIGQLLRESTQGTLDLLVARAATKHEMGTGATIIVSTGNNPLKFSPSVEAALAHMLHPPKRGFMPGADALADAYHDLRAHQMGVVAGMRAALAGVFERFEPARIEARLTQHSMLDALLPQLNRRARCWDLFTELYGQLSSEAADDFHVLFGRAFAAAYEAQIDRIKQRKP